MAAVIATTNQKGGVGKTTTACALLAGLHQRGAKVLGVDLDPQGSLGFCLGLDIDNCATVYDVMKGATPSGRPSSHRSAGISCPATSC